MGLRPEQSPELAWRFQRRLLALGEKRHRLVDIRRGVNIAGWLGIRLIEGSLDVLVPPSLHLRILAVPRLKAPGVPLGAPAWLRLEPPDVAALLVESLQH